jgi:hypothetical protein
LLILPQENHRVNSSTYGSDTHRHYKPGDSFSLKFLYSARAATP